jgi:parvulin-like peptidyl-prolyl isomerase
MTARKLYVPVAILLLAGFFSVWYIVGIQAPNNVASESTPEPVVLAVVNDEPITERELAELLKARHMARERKTGESKDFRGLLDEMIAERLIIQEGLRMGLDLEPDVQEQLELVEKSAAEGLLVRKEVKESVTLTEEETKAYFEKLFERVHVRQIVTETSEEAEAVLKELEEGADFGELAKERSIGYKAKDGGDLGTFARHSVYPPLEEGLFSLSVGEVSRPIVAPDGFHIVRIEERFPAEAEKFPKFKDKVEARLRSLKEKELYRALVGSLRERAAIKVYKEKLGALDRAKVLNEAPDKPGEPVAEVEGTPVPMAFYWQNLNRRLRLKTVSEEEFKGLKEEVLDKLIDRIVLRKEAEKRKLAEDPSVQHRVDERLRILVRRKFIGLVILPKVEQGEEALRDYYEKNQEKYRESGRVRLARLAASSQQEADELRKRVKAGTDFNWIVEHESEDPKELVSKGGDLGWTREDLLKSEVREAVANIPIGDLSEPIKFDSTYYLYYVRDKEQGAVEPFATVKGRVSKDYLQHQVKAALSEWAEKLKSVSTVTINEERLAGYMKGVGGGKH